MLPLMSIFVILLDMIKKERKKRVYKSAVWLAIISISLELINALYSYFAGHMQPDSCPKDPLPPQISVALSALSAFILVAAYIQAKNYKLLVTSVTLLYLIMIVLGYFFLTLLAGGGLNFCSY